ncbi:TonB-dependent receptor [Flavobacterium agricola]|uniref:TonB-dependent receptor n=1 Tax=Flavobacterium agricola TaxID=2870839 RepID=A0ABY6M127_9FLAO|nr:TonB-dependent receptor [Flavobacterium agricola]UYW02269.1 TonB-dependent receptor [Flavobacterium agricola]
MRFTFNFCCYLVFFATTGAVAQVVQDSIYHLQQLEIFTQKNKEVIAGQSLKGEALQRLNSQSVADAVRYFSGVQLKDYGGVGGIKTIDVRGMGSQHVGVFYDGIQLGNAQNGVVDLGKYALDDLEAISLYNGQKSSVFQAAKHFASASSIYLQSKKPVFNADAKTNVTFRYKTGSIQLVNPSFRIEQKLSDAVFATASAEYIKSDGEYKFRYSKKNLDQSVAYDTTAIRKDGQIDAKRFELGLFGEKNNTIWQVKGYSYLSDRGIPGAIVRGRFDARGQTLVDKNYFLQATIEQKVGRFETKLNTKYANDYTRFTDTVSLFKYQNTYKQQEFYASWATVYKATSTLYINVAADYQFNTLDVDLTNFSYPKRKTTWVAFAASYQQKKLQFQASVLGTFVTESVKKNTNAPDKNIWAPTLLAQYKINNAFSIQAFYKRIFRMPTFNDLYYTALGYSNLKPEYATQYNFGFTYAKPLNGIVQQISIQADGYYNLITDKIIAAPNGSMFRWMMMNLGKVQILGTDVKLKSDFIWGQTEWQLMLNYSYQKAQDYSNKKTTYYKHQIAYIPWHSGSAVLNANNKTWGANYSFIYVGERYDANQDNIQYNHINPWFTHDVSIQKTFAFNRYTSTLSFQVNNILNQYYDVVLNYPMPGRQFKFILNLTI